MSGGWVVIWVVVITHFRPLAQTLMSPMGPIIIFKWCPKKYIFKHDSTISSLFAAFGFKRTDFNRDGFPMHASCISIELWMKPDKSTYIRVFVQFQKYKFKQI
jgi:hypothetical protein